tara:strand:+ start:908 stop:2443 length:1536 start_codon:yes stop_codon:yes gene_type:complete
MAQQLQNITVAAPGFSGLNTQESPIGGNPSFAAVADNCVIDKLGRIGARKGWEEVSSNGSSVLGNSRGIETVFEFVDTTGDKIIISAGNNKIFKGSSTLVDITPSGYTPTANNWKCVTFNNHLYMVQLGHVPLIGTDESGSFVLEAITSHSHATGTMPLANEALAAFGKLWVTDIIDNKHIVYWSDTLNGHAWTGGASGSLNLTTVWPTGHDEVVSLAVHNNFLVIFGKKSILVYSGASSPASMILADTVEGVGCIARDSVQHTGTDILFLSDSGVRSFGRTIQEKSMPMRDISKNVRTDLTSLVPFQTNAIKSLYSADNAFYLLTLPDSNTVYCFDMRTPMEDGSQRATTWSGMYPLCFTLLESGEIYIGLSSGIVEYSKYLDGTASYQMRYFSNPMDFGNASNLKFLKKFNITIIGGQNTESTLSWGYDYTNNFIKQVFTLTGSIQAAEYGVSEYNTTAEYGDAVVINTPKVNTSGSGEVVSIGIETQINNTSFSIQKIDIHALLGRLI